MRQYKEVMAKRAAAEIMMGRMKLKDNPKTPETTSKESLDSTSEEDPKSNNIENINKM